MGHTVLDATRECKASTKREARAEVLGKEGPGVDGCPWCLRCGSTRGSPLSLLEESVLIVMATAPEGLAPKDKDDQIMFI